MKKALSTLFIILISVVSFAEINITEKGKLTNTIIATDSYCCVVRNDNNYELRVISQNNTENTSMIGIILGVDEQAAISSLSQIEQWMNTATISEYLIIGQEGGHITIYKASNNRYVISSGDQYYCKQILTSIATGWEARTALPYGYCTNVIVKKALKQLKDIQQQ